MAQPYNPRMPQRIMSTLTIEDVKALKYALQILNTKIIEIETILERDRIARDLGIQAMRPSEFKALEGKMLILKGAYITIQNLIKQ